MMRAEAATPPKTPRKMGRDDRCAPPEATSFSVDTDELEPREAVEMGVRMVLSVRDGVATGVRKATEAGKKDALATEEEEMGRLEAGVERITVVLEPIVRDTVGTTGVVEELADGTNVDEQF